MKSRFSEEQIIAILKQHQARVPVADLRPSHLTAAGILVADRPDRACLAARCPPGKLPEKATATAEPELGPEPEPALADRRDGAPAVLQKELTLRMFLADQTAPPE